MHDERSAAFRSTDGTATLARMLLAVSLGLAVAAVASGLLQWELISRAESGGITMAEAQANDARQRLIGIFQLLAFVATAAGFLTWFYRSHKNLSALGNDGIQHGSGWAIGGFFVPFLNLVRPLQLMRETWHGSDPDALERDLAPDGAAARHSLGTPPLIGAWWGLFLAAGIVGNMTFRLAFKTDPTIAELKQLTLLYVLSDALEVPGALLAILLVARLTRRQTERRRNLLLRSDVGAAQPIAEPIEPGS